MLVEFDAKNIPRELYYGFIRHNVREFVPKLIRCLKCQEYGQAKRRCARCSGDHEYGECRPNIKPKCCNCGGEHSVAYWGCDAMRREMDAKIPKIMSLYADKSKRENRMLRQLRRLDRTN